MTVGMLWFDNSKDSLAEKVRRAVAHYVKKYGRRPELCLVPVGTEISKEERELDGVIVRPWRGVLPCHLWIGIEDQNEMQIAEAGMQKAEVLA